MKRFEGKTVLITGAASGIGFASTEQFAREGATVVATDLRIEDLDAAFANLIAEGLSIEKAVQDVREHETWTRTVDGIIERHGRLDVLFNNAGGDILRASTRRPLNSGVTSMPSISTASSSACRPQSE